MALKRNDKGVVPGTGAGLPEGSVADGQAQYEVHVVLSGTPSQIATDYATLVTNVAALTSASTISWNKR